MELKQWISLLLFLIFLSLSLIHVYWAYGGKRGLTAALPQTENLEPVMKLKSDLLSKISTLSVALTLALFGLFSLELGKFISIFGESAPFLGLLTSAAFALRCVGDFKYVGFFKKVKNTPFAYSDSVLYIPLCLIISGSLLFLIL
jgi:hypothetical protein